MPNLDVPSDLFEYSSFVSAINLVDPAVGRAYARTLKVTTAGTITVKLTASRSVARVLNVADGETVDGQFTSIDSVTGVTRIRVGW